MIFCEGLKTSVVGKAAIQVRSTILDVLFIYTLQAKLMMLYQAKLRTCILARRKSTTQQMWFFRLHIGAESIQNDVTSRLLLITQM